VAGFAKPDGTKDDERLAATISGLADSVTEQRRKFKIALRAYVSMLDPKGVLDEPTADKAFDTKFTGPISDKGFDSLTLKQYVDLWQHPDCWPKVQPLFKIEKDAFGNLLDGVRDVRNALAHFREITPSGRSRLRVCAHWLEQCQRPAPIAPAPR